MFYKLDAHPIYQWDESRQAINMQEMLANNQPLVTYFEGKPDHYNTKPPLLIWLQVIFMLLTDNPEFAMRLPSAFAAVCTIITLVFFFNATQKKPKWGIFAGLVLVSSFGYTELHSVRTGDFDALVTLWIALIACQYYLDLETEKRKFLYQAAFFFGLAIATKASVPFMLLPFLFIWTILIKKLRFLLFNKALYFAMLIPLTFILVFYFFREAIDPGYLKSAWHNDFYGRFSSAIDNHKESWDFYFFSLFHKRAPYFILSIPLAFPLIYFSKNQAQKKLALFALLFIITFLAIISISKTKIFWYDTPIFPFLAIVVTLNVIFILDCFSKRISLCILSVITASILWFPYHKNLQYISSIPLFDWEKQSHYQPSYLLKSAIDGEIDLQNHTLLTDDVYTPYFNFYITRLAQKKGYTIPIKYNISEMEVNEVFIYYQPHIFGESLKKYNLKEVKKINEFVYFYKKTKE